MHAGSFLIADLFGNTSVKYRQEDDTLALAVKMGGGNGGEGGGWHMMGDVVPSPDEALVGQIRGLRPVLELMKDVKKVFVPPIPRFVFGGCCATKHHAPNTASPDHPAKMLTEHIRQRHTITKALIDSKTAHFQVTDVLSIFSSTHDSITDKARKFRTFSHKDNVHLTPAGYRLLAEEIVLDCNTISAKQQATAKQAEFKPPPPCEEKTWWGFRTTRGIGRTSAVPQRGRGGYRHHPTKEIKENAPFSPFSSSFPFFASYASSPPPLHSVPTCVLLPMLSDSAHHKNAPADSLPASGQATHQKRALTPPPTPRCKRSQQPPTLQPPDQSPVPPTVLLQNNTPPHPPASAHNCDQYFIVQIV